jgi:hypothetical protein
MRLALKTTTMAEPSEPIAARFPHGKGLAVPKPSENRDRFAVDCFLQQRVTCELTRSFSSQAYVSERNEASPLELRSVHR